jgi:hypothetical protein
MREATYQETGQGLSYQECARDLTRLKKEPEYTWLREADSQALQQSLRDLGKLRWQAVIAQDFGLFLLEQGQSREAEAHIREGLELAATLSSQADVLAGLLPMAHWQAQNDRFVEAMVAVSFIKDNKIASLETHGYGQVLWEELSSELPLIFAQRAQGIIETANLDDILSMMSV